MYNDLRYAFCQLVKTPGFTIVAALSLALGIGANTTIFSALNALVYRPLPYKDPDRLVVIWETNTKLPGRTQEPSVADVLDWRTQNHVFEDIASVSGLEGGTETLTDANGAERVTTQGASPNLFSLLGIKPAMGRVPVSEDVRSHGETVVISDSFWRRRFDGSPDVLGRAFNIEGTDCTVVGVMPPGLSRVLHEKTDVWMQIPTAIEAYSKRTDHDFMAIARLKPGVTLQQAQSDIEVIAARLEQEYSETNKDRGAKIVPLHEDLSGWARGILYPLFGAVSFVLLIACCNVANLVLVRTEARRKEFAVRASLGAGRLRLVRQLLIESALLALLGGLLGVLIATWGIQIFRSLASAFPWVETVNLDLRVLLFTLTLSLLTSFLFGVFPALQASNPDLNVTLKQGDKRTSTGSGRRIRSVLVISEIALALVLLVGAGLMMNTVLRLQRVQLGFNPENVLTMEIFLSEAQHVTHIPGGFLKKVNPRATRFYQQVLERIQGLPGVKSAGMISLVPPGWMEARTFTVSGRPAPDPEKRPYAYYAETSSGLFRTLEIPLKRGRYLDERDVESAPWAVVINETFARRFFPGENPLGQQLRLRSEPFQLEENREREIVGIVGDVKNGGPARDTPPALYVSYRQQPDTYAGGYVATHLRQDLVIRTMAPVRGVTESLTAAVRRIVAEVDKDQPVYDVMTLEQVLSKFMSPWRFYLQLMGLFAGLALTLAAVGIYGVISYGVGERTHEIGLRMALGAQRADVLRLVVKQGLILTLAGLVIGLATAAALTRLIARFLFGVTPTDTVTFFIVSLLLMGVALLACYVAARQATKIDPMVALRCE
jgi:predicted permease